MSSEQQRKVARVGYWTNANHEPEEIVNGPTINGLKVAFCNAYGENDASTRFELKLKTMPGLSSMEISVKLSTLQYVDLSGLNYNFEGYITSINSDKEHCIIGRYVGGCYNAKTRKGFVYL